MPSPRNLLDTYLATPFSHAGRTIPWFGPAMTGGVVALTVNLTATTVAEFGSKILGLGTAWGLVFDWLVVGVVASVTLLGVNRYYRNEMQRARQQFVLGPFIDKDAPPKQHGLIFALSEGPTVAKALEYHSPVLQHCWLLVTPQTQAEALQVVRDHPALRIDLRDIPDLYNTQSCYEAVQDILLHESARLRWAPADIITDITGGTKPMSMGMITAALERGCPIEHVPTQFGPDGKAIGPLDPIAISCG